MLGLMESTYVVQKYVSFWTRFWCKVDVYLTWTVAESSERVWIPLYLWLHDPGMWLKLSLSPVLLCDLGTVTTLSSRLLKTVWVLTCKAMDVVPAASSYLVTEREIQFFFLNFIYLFIFGCVRSSLLRVGFSLVAASRGYSSLRCTGFSLRWLLLLWSTGSRHEGFSSCGTWAQ